MFVSNPSVIQGVLSHSAFEQSFPACAHYQCEKQWQIDDRNEKIIHAEHTKLSSGALIEAPEWLRDNNQHTHACTHDRTHTRTRAHTDLYAAGCVSVSTASPALL